MKNKVFVGYDTREDIAYQVCEHSLKRFNTETEVIPLIQKDLRDQKIYQIIFMKILNYFDQNIGVRITNKVNISSLPRSIANAKTVLLKVLIDE